MKRLAACGLALALCAQPAQTQETQTDPAPNLPAPKVQKDPAPVPQQRPAPIERRSNRPSTASPEPISGPLSGQTRGSDSQRPVNADGDVGTLRVNTRLVNVAVNV